MKSKAFEAALAAVAAESAEDEADGRSDEGCGMPEMPEKQEMQEMETRESSEAKPDHWMNYVHSNEPMINDNELISLSALIAYVAHITQQNEFRVERQFADRFNIPNVKCLPIERYDDAVRYLVDQVPMFAA